MIVNKIDVWCEEDLIETGRAWWAWSIEEWAESFESKKGDLK